LDAWAGVPDDDAAVLAGGGESRSCGIHGEVVDETLGGDERVSDLPSVCGVGDIPQSRGAVVSSGGSEASIGRKPDRVDGQRRAGEDGVESAW
jgi:hypothetical protein